jgi:mannose-6-phosphate isomerase-like protein (cupin superfamily)
MNPINILDKFAGFSEQWAPRRIAEVDDMQVLLARLQGSFVWHAHDREDELFQVIKGTLYMQLKTPADEGDQKTIRTKVVREGELFVVPKGVEHNPMTKDGEEVLVLLFEKKSTAHTGGVVHERTKTEYQEI